MVFVPMRDDNPEDLVPFAAQIIVIGNDVIYPEHIVFWKHNSRIYDQDFSIEFVDGHILADFPESAQGNDFQFSVLAHLVCFTSLT